MICGPGAEEGHAEEDNLRREGFPAPRHPGGGLVEGGKVLRPKKARTREV